MAYRRSITSRVNLLTQRFHPSFSYVLHDDDGKHQHSAGDSSRTTNSNFLQRGYNNCNANSATSGLGALFQERRSVFFSLPSAVGSSYCSYSSSAIEEGSDKIEYMSDVAEVLSEKSMEIVASQAPIVSEVAIAAQDSFFPVAALQYLIDGVHSFTGFNWWLSIALTTLLIRGATVPLLINQLKATQKLTLMRPRLEEIKQQMQDTAADPNSVYEGRQKMNKLFEEHGVTPFTPLKGLFVQGPVFISFFLGITNMVEKVPSFKTGGAFWFTDLTTPDTLYVLPVLTALSFLITVECNMQEGLEGNPIAGTMKKFSRILAVLTVPFTMSFPKAIFCYWITSNLFSLCYGLVLKRPPVKKYLGIPEMQMPPPTTGPQGSQGPQSPFSLFLASKPSPRPSEPVSTEPIESVPKELPSKVSDRRISSSSVISQRLRTLEKQVKARNKNKK